MQLDQVSNTDIPIVKLVSLNLHPSELRIVFNAVLARKHGACVYESSHRDIYDWRRKNKKRNAARQRSNIDTELCCYL